MVNPQYDSFHYAMLNGNIMVEKNGKFGFIDMFTGQETIPNSYSQFQSDKNRNYVLLKNNSDWYRIDTLNKAQKIGKGDDILCLGFGLYKLKRNEKWGVVDSIGIVKSDFSFDEITKLHTEEYYLAMKDHSYGLINTKGQVLIEPKFDKVGFQKSGNIYGQKGFYQFTLNTEGKILDKEFKPEIIKNVFFGLLISLMIGLTVFVVKIK